MVVMLVMLVMLAVMAAVCAGGAADGAGLRCGCTGRRGHVLGSCRGRHEQRCEQEQESFLHAKDPPKSPGLQSYRTAAKHKAKIDGVRRHGNQAFVLGVTFEGTICTLPFQNTTSPPCDRHSAAVADTDCRPSALLTLATSESEGIIPEGACTVTATKRDMKDNDRHKGASEQDHAAQNASPSRGYYRIGRVIR